MKPTMNRGFIGEDWCAIVTVIIAYPTFRDALGDMGRVSILVYRSRILSVYE